MGNSYLHNNEALATVAIGHFISVHKEIELPKMLFVLPFVLHEPTVKKLKGQSHKRSLEEFIIKNIDCVINFNSRFQDYLPLSINAISILRDIGLVFSERNVLKYNQEFDGLFQPEGNRLVGNRANDIFKANVSLHKLMLSEKTASFYLKLRIVL